MSLTSAMVIVYVAFIWNAATFPISNVLDLASSTSGNVRKFETVYGHNIDTMSSLAVGHGVDLIEQSPAVNEDRWNDEPNGGGPPSFQSDDDYVGRPIDIGELSQDSAERHAEVRSDNGELLRQNQTRPDPKEYGDEDEEENYEDGDEDDADYDKSNDIVQRNIIYDERGRQVSADMGMLDVDQYHVITRNFVKNKPRVKTSLNTTKSSSTDHKRKTKIKLRAVRDKKKVKSVTRQSGNKPSGLQSKTAKIKKNAKSGQLSHASLHPIKVPIISSNRFALTGSYRPSHGSSYQQIGQLDDGYFTYFTSYASPSLPDYQHQYQIPRVQQWQSQVVSTDLQSMHYQDTSSDTRKVFQSLPGNTIVFDEVIQPERRTNGVVDNWLVPGDGYLQSAYYEYSQPTYDSYAVTNRFRF